MRVNRPLRGAMMKAFALVGLHPWLTCLECVESVTEFLEGASSPQYRDRVLAHLKICPDCPRYFRQMELTIRLAREVPTDSIPLAARAALLDAFRNWHRAGDEDP
jgi:predicted anti-sigma-YlaC factor YlaD